ncbi:hypothetical protein OH77DRAFT_1440540 [Trametes cingulata]|nr:hypothetical protein OH77DRAFT_1440540 [Trametes cingulata]
MYWQLLLKYAADFYLERSASQPRVLSIDVHQSDRFNLSDSWKLNISEEEDLFLLRNVSVKVGDQTRYGHAALHLCYFPPAAEKTRQSEAGQSSSPSRKRRRPTYQEFMESLEEMAMLETERPNPSWTPGDFASSSAVSSVSMEDSSMSENDSDSDGLDLPLNVYDGRRSVTPRSPSIPDGHALYTPSYHGSFSETQHTF